MNKQSSLNRFVVADPNRCIGCRVCELACSMVHAQESRPRTVGSMKNPIQPRLHLVRYRHGYVPIQCHHCEDAPCANACQVSAIIQKDGVIFIDEEKCMGCKTCMLACPFGAMELAPLFKDGRAVEQHLPLADACLDDTGGHEQNKQRYVASKCDLCLTEEQPGCVTNCPQQALTVAAPQKQRAQRMYDAALSLVAVVNNYPS